MAPFYDEPVTPSRPRDPVRLLVQALLALYLSPVVLIVCLVGAAYVLINAAVKISRRIAGRLGRGNDHRPNLIIRSRSSSREIGMPRNADRRRSQMIRR